jgi:hypothetical protein
MALSNLKKAGIGGGLAIVVAVGLIGSMGQMIPGGGYTVATVGTCTAGERPERDASGAWQCRYPNDYRSTSLDYVEEFLTSVVPDWISSGQTGTGASSFGGSTAAGRPGIVDLTTGSTATGSARWGGSVSNSFDLATMTVTFEVTGGWLSLSTGTDEYASPIGVGSATSVVDQTNACMFLYDRGNVATGGQNTGNANILEAVSASGGSRTIVPLDGASHGGVTTVSVPVAAMTPPNTNVRTYTVIAGNGQCVFEVDGTTVATLTTNIPSGTSQLVTHMFAIIKNAGTGSPHMQVDRAHLHIELNTRRL